MSISPNVGALSAHLNRIISGELYNKMREEVDNLLKKIPAVGEQMTNLAHRLEEAVKGLIVPGRLFEDLGFTYFGPIDGHKLSYLLETFESVKKLKGPRLIHVVTRKGKGYVHAEEQSGSWHGTSPFEISTGKRKKSARASYTSIFGKTMVELAENDEKIVAVTAAMKEGTGLVEFAEKFPERFFDVGIAEQHAVTFAGALAAEGYKPVAAIYSTFLQRAYDQLVHDIGNMNLPVCFALDRAGIVGDDGVTHQGVFDFSYLRHVPNMTVMAPKDENELRHMIFTAANHNGPAAVRYPRGAGLGVPLEQEFRMLEIGKGELLKEGNDLLICAIGNRVSEAEMAAEMLEREGYSIALINARFVKPLDTELIASWARRCGHVLTVEENAVMGGFGSGVFEELRNAGLGSIAGAMLGVPDHYVAHASQESSRKRFGLDAKGITLMAKDFLKLPSDVVSLFNMKKDVASK
jgi:1-deoxy-D-xylulose-5-phosphate synthase